MGRKQTLHHGCSVPVRSSTTCSMQHCVPVAFLRVKQASATRVSQLLLLLPSSCKLLCTFWLCLPLQRAVLLLCLLSIRGWETQTLLLASCSVCVRIYIVAQGCLGFLVWTPEQLCGPT